AEKQIAIDFARKELSGTERLAAVRRIYAAILTDQNHLSAPVETEAVATPVLNAAELEKALSATLGALRLTQTGSRRREDLILDALADARSLAARIGDDSNLTLDPDLDTYYLQDIVVGKLPTLLGQFGEAQRIFREVMAAGALSGDHNVRFIITDKLLRS